MPVIIIFLAVLSLITILLATGLGPVSVEPGTTAKILLSRIPGIGNSVSHTWEQLDQNIVLGLRLPRVCLGMVVGASLAVCGDHHAGTSNGIIWQILLFLVFHRELPHLPPLACVWCVFFSGHLFPVH